MVISRVSFDLAKYPDIEDAVWKAYWFLRKHRDFAYNIQDLVSELPSLTNREALCDALTYLTDLEVLDEREADGLLYYIHERDLPQAKVIEDCESE